MADFISFTMQTDGQLKSSPQKKQDERELKRVSPLLRDMKDTKTKNRKNKCKISHRFSLCYEQRSSSCRSLSVCLQQRLASDPAQCTVEEIWMRASKKRNVDLSCSIYSLYIVRPCCGIALYIQNKTLLKSCSLFRVRPYGGIALYTQTKTSRNILWTSLYHKFKQCSIHETYIVSLFKVRSQ